MVTLLGTKANPLGVFLRVHGLRLCHESDADRGRHSEGKHFATRVLRRGIRRSLSGSSACPLGFLQISFVLSPHFGTSSIIIGSSSLIIGKASITIGEVSIIIGEASLIIEEVSQYYENASGHCEMCALKLVPRKMRTRKAKIISSLQNAPALHFNAVGSAGTTDWSGPAELMIADLDRVSVARGAFVNQETEGEAEIGKGPADCADDSDRIDRIIAMFSEEIVPGSCFPEWRLFVSSALAASCSAGAIPACSRFLWTAQRVLVKRSR